MRAPAGGTTRARSADVWDGRSRNRSAPLSPRIFDDRLRRLEKNLIADIRANGRPTSGYFEGRPVMVLTTTGAKSGEPRTVVVSFSRDGDDYVVVGSKSGEPEDPAWFTNLVANPVVTVESDGQTFQARATVAEGADRDALWDRHVAEHPQFAGYPAKTDRIIPIARLKRLG